MAETQTGKPCKWEIPQVTKIVCHFWLHEKLQISEIWQIFSHRKILMNSQCRSVPYLWPLFKLCLWLTNQARSPKMIYETGKSLLHSIPEVHDHGSDATVESKLWSVTDLDWKLHPTTAELISRCFRWQGNWSEGLWTGFPL